MSDVFDPAKRSAVMARIKSRDTKPELLLRRLLTQMGARYRLHRKDLPGSPDVAMPGRRLAIFVHGCFWHRCPTCQPPNPRSHSEFWTRKFELNVERDARKRAQLEAAGWLVLEIWECDVRDRLMASVTRVQEAIADRPSRARALTRKGVVPTC